MPRASTSTASQKAPRRSRRDVSGDEEEDEEDGPGPATQGRDLGDADIKKRASLLVRTALTMHYAGKVYRRSDMSSLVGGNRFLLQVFSKAQQTLRYTMGMELYEMPQKWKQADLVAAARAQAEDRRAAESQSQSQSQMSQARKGKGRARPSGLQTLEEEDEEEEEDGEHGTQTQVQAQVSETQAVAGKKEKGSQIYVLRSILRPQLRQALSNAEPFPDSVLPRSNNPMDADSGAPLRWEAAEASSSGAVELVAMRSVILALILANGRQLSNADLLTYFHRLDIRPDTPLPFSARETPNPQPLVFEKYLDLLDRSLYLQKIKPTGPNTVQPGESANANVEWRWGQRAHAEFGEKAAAVFIQDVMFEGVAGADDDGDGDSADEAPGSNRRRSGTQRNGNGSERGADGEDVELSVRKRRKKMMKDLEAAAGSELRGQL